MSKPRPTVMEYRNYYLPPAFPVLLLSGDNWKISSTPSSRLHFHNCMEIGYCHTDSGILKTGKESLEFHAGDVTFLPRNVPHTTWSSPGTESRWSYLFLDSGALLRSMCYSGDTDLSFLPHASQNLRYILPGKEFPLAGFLVTEIIRALEQADSNYRLFVKGLFLSLMVELSRIQQKYQAGQADAVSDSGLSSPELLSIAPALDYIEDCYQAKISMDTLAGICHMSTSHFRRIFHSIMQISPLDYLNNVRIMKACNLLCSTQDSILIISEMTGFPSISNFNRHFLRVMKQSPREYRRQQLSQPENGSASGPFRYSIMEFSGWMQPEESPE